MSQSGSDPSVTPSTSASNPIAQLRKEMGFWDVLLFNIATVLGPRWMAAAAHNGTSSISLWVLAALFFFVPTAMVVNELSSRFPEEGYTFGPRKRLAIFTDSLPDGIIGSTPFFIFRDYC